MFISFLLFSCKQDTIEHITIKEFVIKQKNDIKVFNIDIDNKGLEYTYTIKDDKNKDISDKFSLNFFSNDNNISLPYKPKTEGKKIIYAKIVGRNEKSNTIEIEAKKNINIVTNKDYKIIPLYFTIIHNGSEIGSGINVSNDVIERNIKTLNKGFSGKTDVTGDNIKVEFEFVLGGINRYKGTKTGYTVDEMMKFKNTKKFKDSLYQDSSKYINIFCFNSTTNSSFTTLPPIRSVIAIPGLVTFKTEPQNIQLDYVDGIFLNVHDVIKNSSVITHEMGHFWGLLHVFIENNDPNTCETLKDADFCPDTRNSKIPKANFFPSFERVDCDGKTYISENFMDYQFSFIREFTKNQKTRMHHVINNAFFRKSLVMNKNISSKNHNNTIITSKKTKLKPKYIFCKKR